MRSIAVFMNEGSDCAGGRARQTALVPCAACAGRASARVITPAAIADLQYSHG